LKPPYRATVRGSVVASDLAGNSAGSGNADLRSDLGIGRGEGRHAQRATRSNPDATSANPPRLLDQVRARMRRLGMAIRLEDAYLGWIRRFILANGKHHPRALGGREVEAFLTDLAVRGQVAASTPNQALSALLFLYREVLEIELPWMDGIRRAKRPERTCARSFSRPCSPAGRLPQKHRLGFAGRSMRTEVLAANCGSAANVL